MFFTTMPMVTFSTVSTFSPRVRRAPPPRSGLCGACIMRLRDVAADHVPHQLLARHLRRLRGDHQLAIAQHSDAVGNLQAFLERVGDVNDGDAARPQVADEVEEMNNFFGGQARGRLVEVIMRAWW